MEQNIFNFNVFVPFSHVKHKLIFYVNQNLDLSGTIINMIKGDKLYVQSKKNNYIFSNIRYSSYIYFFETIKNPNGNNSNMIILRDILNTDETSSEQNINMIIN